MSQPSPAPHRNWGRYTVIRRGKNRPCPPRLRERLVAFLHAYELHGLVANALSATRTPRRTYNSWLLKYPDFAADVQDLTDDRHDRRLKFLNRLSKQGHGTALHYLLRLEQPERYGRNTHGLPRTIRRALMTPVIPIPGNWVLTVPGSSAITAHTLPLTTKSETFTRAN